MFLVGQMEMLYEMAFIVVFSLGASLDRGLFNTSFSFIEQACFEKKKW